MLARGEPLVVGGWLCHEGTRRDWLHESSLGYGVVIWRHMLACGFWSACSAMLHPHISYLVLSVSQVILDKVLSNAFDDGFKIAAYRA